MSEMLTQINPLQKIQGLSAAELDRVTTQIGDAFAAEKGGMAEIIDRKSYAEYMKIAAEIGYESGYLYTLDYKGYIIFYPKMHPIPLRYHFRMAGKVLKRLKFSTLCKYFSGISGWVGYEKLYKKDNYLVVFMIAVPLEYQGQGRMKPLLSFAFAEAEKLGVQCVLDTDTQLKKDKYIRCGMHLKHEQRLKSGVTVYVLER